MVGTREDGRPGASLLRVRAAVLLVSVVALLSF